MSDGLTFPRRSALHSITAAKPRWSSEQRRDASSTQADSIFERQQCSSPGQLGAFCSGAFRKRRLSTAGFLPRLSFIVILILAEGGIPTRSPLRGWNAAQVGRPAATLVGTPLEAGFNVHLCGRRRRHGHCPRDVCKRAKVCNQIICLLQGISHPVREIVSYLPLAFLSFSCAHKRSARTVFRLSASFFETTTAHFGFCMTLEGFPFCHNQLSIA